MGRQEWCNGEEGKEGTVGQGRVQLVIAEAKFGSTEGHVQSKTEGGNQKGPLKGGK